MIVQEKDLEKCLSILKSGGIVIYPTDTIYGIGCSIEFEDSVKKIYQIKQRGENHPLPVAFSSLKQAREYTMLSKEQESIIKKAIKSKEPFTFIVKKNGKISKSISKEDTVGMRILDNKIARELTGAVGPIITTSANIHGKSPAAEFKDLDPEIIKRVDMVIEGECKSKKPSKIVNLLNGEILRA